MVKRETLSPKVVPSAANSWDAASAEAQAEGVPYTSFIETTDEGAAENITNFDVNMSASEAGANLQTNGYWVYDTTPSGSNVPRNGANYYSFYTRNSTEAVGMQYNPGLG